MAAIGYKESGVDRAAADHLVDRIAQLAKTTRIKGVKASIGGYASLFEIDSKRWLAASTDGVGTKLKLAFRLNNHQTIGIDLVAMSVNDLLCVGAKPLFFLDYFATGRLDQKVTESVISGIVKGCREGGVALVGGETAEMPGFYHSGEYDLAGFAVGILDRKNALPKHDIRPGDTLIGINSSGCHSNGFSLLRQWLPEGPNGDAIARKLLTPTKIYAKTLCPLIAKGLFKGLAHITGSGFLNVPRMSPKVDYRIELPPLSVRPKIYDWVARQGLGFSELAQTFNLGIGMVGVTAPKDTKRVLSYLKRAGEKAWILGHVERRSSAGSKVFISDPSSNAEAVLDG